MNASRFPQQLELAFWSFAIPLMRESEQVRYFIQHGYRLVQKIMRIPMPVRVLALSAAGLVLGLMIGYASARW